MKPTEKKGKKIEEYEICPNCEGRLIFTDDMRECHCSNKKCDFGKKVLVIYYNKII